MKFLFAVMLFTLLGVAFSRKLTEDMLLVSSKSCFSELGISVETLLDNVDDEFVVPEGNVDLEKLFECMLKKENALDENNLINLDGVKSILIRYIGTINSEITDTQKAADDAMESCKGLQGNSLGDHFAKLSNCFVRYIGNL